MSVVGVIRRARGAGLIDKAGRPTEKAERLEQARLERERQEALERQRQVMEESARAVTDLVIALDDELRHLGEERERLLAELAGLPGDSVESAQQRADLAAAIEGIGETIARVTAEREAAASKRS